MIAVILEPTISVGNVISILVTLVSVGAAFWRVTVRLIELKIEHQMKIEMLWKDYMKRHGLNGASSDQNK